MSNMYDNTATWNPFKGCEFNCSYCIPSFQRQAKRIGKENCKECYNYTPHFHEDRLDRIPSAETIFVAGNGDISFCSTENVMKIIDTIKDHEPRMDKTYYFQSKDPNTFNRFKDELPENCILLTTLESDYHTWTEYKNHEVKEINYSEDISKAPLPRERAFYFKRIDYPRKVVTVEPILDFSHRLFNKINAIDPEYVWIGFNSRPKQVELPEPPEEKVQRLINKLVKVGIEVRGKTLRGCHIPDKGGGKMKELLSPSEKLAITLNENIEHGTIDLNIYRCRFCGHQRFEKESNWGSFKCTKCGAEMELMR